MLFLFIGVLTLAMKYLEFGPVAAWDWWVVLSPFALAALWWWWGVEGYWLNIHNSWCKNACRLCPVKTTARVVVRHRLLLWLLQGFAQGGDGVIKFHDNLMRR